MTVFVEGRHPLGTQSGAQFPTTNLPREFPLRWATFRGSRTETGSIPVRPMNSAQQIVAEVGAEHRDISVAQTSRLFDGSLSRQ